MLRMVEKHLLHHLAEQRSHRHLHQWSEPRLALAVSTDTRHLHLLSSFDLVRHIKANPGAASLFLPKAKASGCILFAPLMHIFLAILADDNRVRWLNWMNGQRYPLWHFAGCPWFSSSLLPSAGWSFLLSSARVDIRVVKLVLWILLQHFWRRLILIGSIILVSLLLHTCLPACLRTDLLLGRSLWAWKWQTVPAGLLAWLGEYGRIFEVEWIELKRGRES